jgi:hypothetical protein
MKFPMIRIGLILLILFHVSCAIVAKGYGIEVGWVIGEGSIACEWEDGYPSGPACITGGTLSEAASDVLTGEDNEPEVGTEPSNSPE